jgi:hypothetical protein
VARHIFQACPVWICTQSNITQASYSFAKAQSCQTFNQNMVLLFVFSFSSFALSSTIGQFYLSFNTIPPFCSFGKIINCTAVQIMK